MRLHTTVALAALVALGGCASAEPEDGGGLLAMMYGSTGAAGDRIAASLSGKPLGSQANPVRADMPPGQRAYLSRLRCSNGQAPTFHRVGNYGPGPYGSIIDGYEVVCLNASPATAMVFLDMYHPGHVETAAPEGFTIVQP